MEGYLAHKWGLQSSLPSSGHSYKSSPPQSTVWSSIKYFTTPINTSAPTLGTQSTANITATAADLEVVLSDNGNAATTLIFYWGDNDGGQVATNWDYNITITNAPENKTLRASLTGLSSGTTYYFRSWATNTANKGDDWGDSTTAFTTVTSSVREDTDAIRYSDLEGWWKLDGNLLDSSGNNRHADPGSTVAFSPSDLSNIYTWYDASGYSSAPATLADKSGNGYNLANSSTGGGSPTVTSNAQNGLNVLTFDSTGTSVNVYYEGNIVGQNTNQTWSILFKPVTGHDHESAGVISYGTNQNGDWNLRAAHSSQFRGEFSKDNATYPAWGSTNLVDNWILATISFDVSGQSVSTWVNGVVKQNQVSNSNGINSGSSVPLRIMKKNNSRCVDGHFAELVSFKSTDSNTRQKVEGYLAKKWGLKSILDSSHPYKKSSPFKAGSQFSSNSIDGSAMSLDLSTGTFAEVSTGGTEDTFDGGSNFSVSMWVKGWPSSAGQSLVSKDNFNPASMGNLMLWLDAEKPDYLSTDGSVSPPTNGESISKWYDLSGKGYHAVPSGANPVWKSSLINSKPGVDLSGTTMKIQNSEVDFDAWSELHVFTVLKVHANTTWSRILGKTIEVSQSNNTAWHYATRRGDYSPPLYFSRARNNSNTDYNRENANSRTTSIHDNPGLFTMSWGGGSFTNRIDGTQNNTVSSTGSIGSLASEPVKLGQGYSLYFSEILIFNDKLSTADEQKIEGYLAHKWDLDGDLPSSHSHKTSAPSFGGWAIGRATSGNDAIALNMENAGGEFSTNVPVNDNNWHHLTTTYGSGNKKIYVDGVEVSTASQTGTVAASVYKMMLGDPDGYSGGLIRPKIDDVRFYRGVLTATEVAAIYNNGSGDIGQPKLAITSPSTFSGSTNKSISYQASSETAYGVTGHDSTVFYELLNVPSGLSLNMTSNTTGTVTGTASTAGTYNFQVKASSTSNDHNWSAVKDITLTVNDYSAWNYALPFTTDYSGGSALKDWNMLVRLSEDSSNGAGNAGFRYSQARSNGSDLRFIDKHGAELKYEIANWNTAGESQVWVRVPYLKSDSNITAFWGNSNAGLPGYANDGSVWDGYFGVYHLEENTGNAVDSSPYGNDLPGVNSPVVVASGMSGKSFSVTQAANNGFLSNSITGNIKAKEGTYIAWIQNNPSATADVNKDFWGIGYNNDSTHFGKMEFGTTGKDRARFRVSGGTTGFGGFSSTNISLNGGWKMLTLVIKDGYATTYVDTSTDTSSLWYHPGLDSITGLSIGRGIDDAGPSTTFDEATFSTVARSAAWITTSYNNQKPDQSSTHI